MVRYVKGMVAKAILLAWDLSPDHRFSLRRPLSPSTAGAELVEALFFFSGRIANAQRKKRCFDKLSTNGFWEGWVWGRETEVNAYREWL